MNVEVFNLMSRIIELRCLVQHESCECKCGLNERVHNSKQKSLSVKSWMIKIKLKPHLLIKK